MTDLAKLREQLNTIDDDIVRLLSKRADLVLEVRKTKRRDNIPTYSSSRERQIIDRVVAIAKQGNFPPEQVERIFVNIIGASRSLIGDLRISYLGPDGSFGLDASLGQFGEAVEFSPEVSVENIVSKVEQAESHFGVIPIRSAINGFCFKTLEILKDSPLLIIAEIEIKERLALCSSEKDLTDIQQVFASSEYIDRSETWVRGNLPAVSLSLDNNIIRAVEKMKSEPSSALILPEVTAKRLGLSIVARGIESRGPQEAKYITLGANPPPKSENDKTSILCSVGDRPGVLREMLEPFSSKGLTLIKIESRPSRKENKEFMFYLEILGHIEQEKVQKAIEELKALSGFVKVLGSYPNVYQS